MPVKHNVHGINWAKNGWHSTSYHLWKQVKTEYNTKLSWDGLAVWSFPKHSHSDFQISHMSNGTNTNICTVYMDIQAQAHTQFVFGKY